MSPYVREIVENLKGKRVFFDFDGVLCECRFESHCCVVREGKSFLEACISEDPYENARPIKIMQEVVENLDSEDTFILGRIAGSQEIDYKRKFLHKHFPKLKDSNMIFVTSKEDKCVFMNYFENNYGKENLVLIEDDLDTIIMAEIKYGINCYHISSFMN